VRNEEGRTYSAGTLRKGNKVHQMLGLGLEKTETYDDKNDKEFEYKYRTNVRYLIEKFRPVIPKSLGKLI
jgi:hypothetical protein